MPAESSSDLPMSPAQVRNSMLTFLEAKPSTALRALSGDSLLAPLLSASRRISSPSVPLSPTEPPMPAIGFTIKPTRTNHMRSLSGRNDLLRSPNHADNQKEMVSSRRLSSRGGPVPVRLCRSSAVGSPSPGSSEHARTEPAEHRGQFGGDHLGLP